MHVVERERLFGTLLPMRYGQPSGAAPAIDAMLQPSHFLVLSLREAWSHRYEAQGEAGGFLAVCSLCAAGRPVRQRRKLTMERCSSQLFFSGLGAGRISGPVSSCALPQYSGLWRKF